MRTVNEKVSAIVIHEHGAPAAVVRVEEIEVPEPGPGEVRVRVLAAPINPADINVVEGKYPLRPKLPGVPGVEGAGRIETTGELVLLPHGFGSWRQMGVARREDLTVVPEGIAPEQAAMLKINPPTALRMLRDFATLAPGDWVVQNAANSGVGVAVIQIAHALGLKTMNLVRRAELVEELRAQGADEVLLDDENAIERLKSCAPKLALNAVGGDSALRMANALAPSGTLVTYGAMGRQPLRIPNGLLIFKDLRWRGFWISEWYQRATVEEREAMFGELFTFAQSGVLQTKIERTYALSEAQEALARAAEGGRKGKILFRPNA